MVQVPQILRLLAQGAPLARPVNVGAIFYRQTACGDAVGYYQALADWLEGAGVVENDRWITSWDGSRMRKDSANPRVDVEISEAPWEG